MDVHKKTTAVAVSQGPGRARFIGTIDSNPRALLKVLGKLGDVQEMSVVYEDRVDTICIVDCAVVVTGAKCSRRLRLRAGRETK